MIDIIPSLGHTKTELVMLNMIALPAAEFCKHANKKGRFPYSLAFADALRTRPLCTLWESSPTFSALGWLNLKRVGRISSTDTDLSRFGGFNTSRTLSGAVAFEGSPMFTLPSESVFFLSVVVVS